MAAMYEYGNMVSIINNPMYEPDILTLERAATIAALEFTKRKAIYEIEKSYYNDFLEILLSADFDNIEEIISRGRIFNLDLDTPMAVVVINNSSADEIEDIKNYMNINGTSSKEDILKAINSFFRQQGAANLIAGIKGNNIVLVMGTDGKEPSEFKETITSLLRYLNNSIRTDTKINIGVGRTNSEIKMISRSYEDAREALKIAQLSDTAHLIFFDNLGFYKILSEKNRSELENYVEELLQPVFDYDRNKKGDLVKTLETYYDTNRNLKMTSKKLYTHYNTVLYRIKKIEELTGISLDHPENALNLEIAVNILKLFRDSSV